MKFAHPKEVRFTARLDDAVLLLFKIKKMRMFFSKKNDNIEVDLISIQSEISKFNSLVTRIKEITLILKSKWKFSVAISIIIVFILLGFVLHAHIPRFVTLKKLCKYQGL